MTMNSVCLPSADLGFGLGVPSPSRVLNFSFKPESLPVGLAMVGRDAPDAACAQETGRAEVSGAAPPTRPRCGPPAPGHLGLRGAPPSSPSFQGDPAREARAECGAREAAARPWEPWRLPPLLPPTRRAVGGMPEAGTLTRAITEHRSVLGAPRSGGGGRGRRPEPGTLQGPPPPPQRRPGSAPLPPHHRCPVGAGPRVGPGRHQRSG